MAEEIQLNVVLNQDLLPKGQRDVAIIARLDIAATDAYRHQHPSVPADICLLLDSSASMDEPFAPGDAHTKREGVIQSAKQMLPHLGAGDTVSIIFYDSQAHLIAAQVPGQRAGEIEQHLDTLHKYNGMTNFEAGLKMAQAVMAQGRNASRRIFFLTDGNATEGSQTNTQTLIGQLALGGVTVDCLGVGADFNFAAMRQLSAPSNGTTEQLESRDRAGRHFEQILVSAQRTIASNVFLTIVFAKGLRDLEVYQAAPETRFYPNCQPSSGGRFTLEIPVQSLRQDRRNIYLCKANLDLPSDANQCPFAEVRLDYDLPPARLKAQRAALTIGVNCLDQAAYPLVDTSVDDMFAEAELAKFYEQFIAIQSQDWGRAATILDEMIRRAHVLNDQARLAHYRTLHAKLQKDHHLSNDDLNRFGSDSTTSTIAKKAAEIGSTTTNLQDYTY